MSRIITDLHIHSKYSRACSANLTPSNIAAWCRTKGVDVIATADYTHPAWLAELEKKLEPAEAGLYRLRPEYVAEDGQKSYRPAPVPAGGGREPRFICSTEIACIYKKGERTRRLHLVVLAPSLAAARKLHYWLDDHGYNVKSDGRPILGLGAKELLAACLETDPGFVMIPAHAWTPWYSVFGSKSGFDSLEECFEELTPEIHAIETGLSSDPPMNWQLSALDKVMLVSNSDAHGLANLGREANAFDLGELSYAALVDVLKQRDRKQFLYTIEFYPEEGKYHADGCRNCSFTCEPVQTDKLKGRCPKCSQLITCGVLGRVHALADRAHGERPDTAVPFKQIVPLEELIGESLGKGKASKAVQGVYAQAIEQLGSEFEILIDRTPEEIAQVSRPLAVAIERMRAGEVEATPGYDGVFGQVKVFREKEKANGPKQPVLL
jgi:uncharacterized protein (TIGR00375 family)